MHVAIRGLIAGALASLVVCAAAQTGQSADYPNTNITQANKTSLSAALAKCKDRATVLLSRSQIGRWPALTGSLWRCGDGAKLRMSVF